MATHSSILAGKYHGQRSLVGYNPWGHKRVRQDLVTKQQLQQYRSKCPPVACLVPAEWPLTPGPPQTQRYWNQLLPGPWSSPQTSLQLSSPRSSLVPSAAPRQSLILFLHGPRQSLTFKKISQDVRSRSPVVLIKKN